MSKNKRFKMFICPGGKYIPEWYMKEIHPNYKYIKVCKIRYYCRKKCDGVFIDLEKAPKEVLEE